MSTTLSALRQTNPLVHCITNAVTINDCANALLAVGASPVMADDVLEVEDITQLAGALVLNIGTLNSRTIESMSLAGLKASSVGKPLVLDPVGAGASKLRTGTAQKLISKLDFTVIRGNLSEIRALAGVPARTQGVDAHAEDCIDPGNLQSITAFAKSFAQKTGAIIAITGAIDIVASNESAVAIRAGHASMSRITGTGCMLSALIGAFVASGRTHPLNATVKAVLLMGLAGERAQQLCDVRGEGTGSFRTYLMDGLSLLDDAALKVEDRFEHY